MYITFSALSRRVGALQISIIIIIIKKETWCLKSTETIRLIIDWHDSGRILLYIYIYIYIYIFAAKSPAVLIRLQSIELTHPVYLLTYLLTAFTPTGV